jgi:putative methionine-R-sulfoxide reductase with GAF domain
VRNAVWSGPGPPEYPDFPVSKGLTGAAISARKTVNVGNVAADPRYLTALDTTQSEIIVPVCDPGSGDVLGTIDVESAARDAFDPDMQALLEACSRKIHGLLI